jgi:hypothetical protein
MSKTKRSASLPTSASKRHRPSRPSAFARVTAADEQVLDNLFASIDELSSQDFVDQLEICINSRIPRVKSTERQAKSNVLRVLDLWRYALYLLLLRADFAQRFGTAELHDSLGQLNALCNAYHGFWSQIVGGVLKRRRDLPFSETFRDNLWYLLAELDAESCDYDETYMSMHALQWFQHKSPLAALVPSQLQDWACFDQRLQPGDNPAFLLVQLEYYYRHRRHCDDKPQQWLEEWDAKWRQISNSAEPFVPRLIAELDAAESRADQLALLDQRIVESNAHYLNQGCALTFPLDWQTSFQSHERRRWGRRLLCYLLLALDCDSPILEAVWLPLASEADAARLELAQRVLERRPPHKLFLSSRAARRVIRRHRGQACRCFTGRRGLLTRKQSAESDNANDESLEEAE